MFFVEVANFIFWIFQIDYDINLPRSCCKEDDFDCLNPTVECSNLTFVTLTTLFCIVLMTSINMKKIISFKLSENKCYEILPEETWNKETSWLFKQNENHHHIWQYKVLHNWPVEKSFLISFKFLPKNLPKKHHQKLLPFFFSLFLPHKYSLHTSLGLCLAFSG